MSDLPQKLRRLNTAVRELSDAADQDQLLERILDVVEKVFDRETAAVLLRDAGGERLRIVCARGYDAKVVESYDAPLGQGVAGAVAASGEPRLVADVTAEPDYVPGVNAAVSEMAVPLTVDGEVIGVLDVESSEGAFSETDMALLEAFGEQAAWAIRHGRALAEAEERARRLALMNQAGRALNSMHDHEELLDRILELAGEALGFNNVAVLVADDDEHLEVLRSLRPEDTAGQKIPVQGSITGAAFSSGEAEIVPDVTADERYIDGGLSGAQAEMVAPLRLNGEIIGVLDAESVEQDAFSSLDLEVFTAFAAQVATALRNSEQMRELSVRARRLKQITRTGRALNTVLDADQLLEQILEAVAEALELERAAILLFYPKRSELIVHAARGYGHVLGKKITVGQGITGTVAQLGEPLLVNDVSADERYVPGSAGGASEMAVPLQVYGELFGVLDTESPVRGAFSEHDLELFHAFADQAAVALHNARQFRRLEMANEKLRTTVEETRRLNRELEAYSKQISQANTNLEMQVKQLTTIHHAGQAITSSLDLGQTLNTILAATAEISECSVGAIKLIDMESKELKVMAHASNGREGAGPTWRYDVPLRIGERTIGVFELVRKAGEELSDGERQMLETLASQAAIAIENARLFENTQQIYYDTLKSLARALEARDDYTRGHSERVARLARDTAAAMGLDDKTRALIFNSALLHDIGKIGVRDEILLKPRKLSDEEMNIIRKHPSFGNVILGPLKFLGEVSELVRYHHERWDGTGYPSGLSGEDIPLPSRIIGVCDTYDAMTSNRPYRDAMTHDEAMELIHEESGKQLDPEVVKTFEEVVEKMRAETEQTSED